MIFKVSFKETPKQPSKAVTKVGLVTTVILKGTVDLPEFFNLIPIDIMDWIRNQKKVEIYENMADHTMQIFSTGMAKCPEDDKYDSILGERLAEARAKYCIYKFFYDLCSKLEEYYNNLLFGPCGVVDSSSGSCIARDLKKYEGLCIRESHHIGELLASKENG
jgi:hypothetical protein